jgi:phosphoribosylamine--glycine ligase
VKLLLVGGGGREHALAWKFRRDDPSLEIVAAPGNPGIASVARCVPIAATDVAGLLRLARMERVDLVMVGPEAPLAAGIVDVFRDAGIPIFGPTKAAAEIETSKSFAKQLMASAGIPTARAEIYRDAGAAKRALPGFGAPVVIKASGLAAGKGVMIANDAREAEATINMMLRDGIFGDAGSEILVEEFMEGEELSLFAITDGIRFTTMLPAQDHKRIGDADVGPNTGGMGAYAPVSIGSTSVIDRIANDVIEPTLEALRKAGRTFTGLLYAGLMLTDAGPRVVEFNCRFGDPETETILPLMRSSLLDLVGLVARGELLPHTPPLDWEHEHAVTTVVAAPGYPDSPRIGAPVMLPPERPGITVFHSGTIRDVDGQLRSAGGRVVAVTAVAPTLGEAQMRSREYAQSVQLDGKQLRTDIGWRDLRRHARAS